MTKNRPFGSAVSTITEPKLEFAFEVRLRFTRAQMIEGMPSGANRSAVYVDSGEFSGPHLRGKAVPNSGGDYSLFRPDDTAQFDARYMLQEDDGTLILVNNRGYLWGYQRRHDGAIADDGVCRGADRESLGVLPSRVSVLRGCGGQARLADAVRFCRRRRAQDGRQSDSVFRAAVVQTQG